MEKKMWKKKKKKASAAEGGGGGGGGGVEISENRDNIKTYNLYAARIVTAVTSGAAYHRKGR